MGQQRLGVAKVSRVQLIQPLLTVTESVLLFGQHLDPAVLIAAVAVLACVTAAKRTRVAGRCHDHSEPLTTATRNSPFD